MKLELIYTKDYLFAINKNEPIKKDDIIINLNHFNTSVAETSFKNTAYFDCAKIIAHRPLDKEGWRYDVPLLPEFKEITEEDNAFIFLRNLSNPYAVGGEFYKCFEQGFLKGYNERNPKSSKFPKYFDCNVDLIVTGNLVTPIFITKTNLEGHVILMGDYIYEENEINSPEPNNEPLPDSNVIEEPLAVQALMQKFVEKSSMITMEDLQQALELQKKQMIEFADNYIDASLTYKKGQGLVFTIDADDFFKQKHNL
jgi:hypothetical protein